VPIIGERTPAPHEARTCYARGVIPVNAVRDFCISRQTAHKLGVRTADLLHVATALDLSVDYLYTFDQQQRMLAQIIRLKLS